MRSIARQKKHDHGSVVLPRFRKWLAPLFFLLPLLFLSFSTQSLIGQSLRKHDSPHPGFFSAFDTNLPPVVLIEPDSLQKTTQDALREFQRVTKKMGGMYFPILPERAASPLFRTITLEHVDLPEEEGFPAGEDDRFRIIVSQRRVRIQAASEIGWEFGLYTLLDEFGGVRWFWPGKKGTHIPERSKWLIPYGTHSFSPAYISRAFSGFQSAPEKEWLRRNRVRPAFAFSHNFHRIFTRELYLEEPDLLPHQWSIDHPPPPHHPVWKYHPDLTLDRVVEIAAEAAILHFERNPDSPSFALGLNDNVTFGSRPAIEELVRPMRYFRDQPIYTDLIFQFMNRVAESVAPIFPEKYLGTLAYWWGEAPPTFSLHPMILPYLTADRSQGYDVNFTEEDRQLVEEWMQTGVKMVGIYEYAHGAPHPFPRRGNLLIGLRISDAYQAGARAYFAEVNPIWPLQGDLAWMMARMLWNPDLNPGTLEEEFTRKFFGGAADPMQRFYAETRWIWMRQGGSAIWVKHFRNEAGIEIFTREDLKKLTGLLEEALALAGTPLEKKRILAVQDTWELSVLFADLQRTRNQLTTTPPDKLALPYMYEFLTLRKAVENKIDQLSTGEWTRNSTRTRFRQSDPTYHAVKNLLLHIPTQEYPRVLDGLYAESIRLKDAAARITVQAALRSIRDRDEATVLMDTHDLKSSAGPWIVQGPEPWEIELPFPWAVRMSPSEKVAMEFEEETGNLHIENAHGAGIAFEFTPKKGTLYEAKITWSGSVSHGNRTQIAFKWWDKDDIAIGLSRSLRMPRGNHENEKDAYVFGYAPPGAVKGALEITTVRQEKDVDWLKIQSLRILEY